MNAPPSDETSGLVDFLVVRSKDLSHGRAPADPPVVEPGREPDEAQPHTQADTLADTNVIPDGSVPEMEKVGGGVPVAVTAKLAANVTVMVDESLLENRGGDARFRVNEAATGTSMGGLPIAPQLES